MQYGTFLRPEREAEADFSKPIFGQEFYWRNKAEPNPFAWTQWSHWGRQALDQNVAEAPGNVFLTSKPPSSNAQSRDKKKKGKKK